MSNISLEKIATNKDVWMEYADPDNNEPFEALSEAQRARAVAGIWPESLTDDDRTYLAGLTEEMSAEDAVGFAMTVGGCACDRYITVERIGVCGRVSVTNHLPGHALDVRTVSTEQEAISLIEAMRADNVRAGLA